MSSRRSYKLAFAVQVDRGDFGDFKCHIVHGQEFFFLLICEFFLDLMFAASRQSHTETSHVRARLHVLLRKSKQAALSQTVEETETQTRKRCLRSCDGSVEQVQLVLSHACASCYVFVRTLYRALGTISHAFHCGRAHPRGALGEALQALPGPKFREEGRKTEGLATVCTKDLQSADSATEAVRGSFW